jgi:DNA polymerase II large subunit
VQETNQNLIKKKYVSKNDSEIDFEEEPGSSLISTKQNNEERYQNMRIIIFLQKPSRRNVTFRTKEIEMIKKSLEKTKVNEQMNWVLNEHCTQKSNNSICSL